MRAELAEDGRESDPSQAGLPTASADRVWPSAVLTNPDEHRRTPTNPDEPRRAWDVCPRTVGCDPPAASLSAATTRPVAAASPVVTALCCSLLLSPAHCCSHGPGTDVVGSRGHLEDGLGGSRRPISDAKHHHREPAGQKADVCLGKRCPGDPWSMATSVIRPKNASTTPLRNPNRFKQGLAAEFGLWFGKARLPSLVSRTGRRR